MVTFPSVTVNKFCPVTETLILIEGVTLAWVIVNDCPVKRTITFVTSAPQGKLPQVSLPQPTFISPVAVTELRFNVNGNELKEICAFW